MSQETFKCFLELMLRNGVVPQTHIITTPLDDTITFLWHSKDRFKKKMSDRQLDEVTALQQDLALLWMMKFKTAPLGSACLQRSFLA